MIYGYSRVVLSLGMGLRFIKKITKAQTLELIGSVSFGLVVIESFIYICFRYDA